MHYFIYKKNKLYCENVSIQKIAEYAGTPFYLYSHRTLLEHYNKIRDAFRSINPIICFSMKSNSSLAVIKSLVNAGAGLDIVSGGELFKAKKAGADSKKIVYASVGKTAFEIEDALRKGILLFNVESVPELELIDKVCARMGKQARAAIRVNPGVKAKTHRYITTGSKENKFGIDEDTLFSVFKSKYKFSHVDICGIHIHIGSQITELAPFVRAIKKASALIKVLRQQGHKIDYFNIGGGLGIVYNRENPQTAKKFAASVIPLVSGLNVRLILEPGRFISGNSGILVTKVLYEKKTNTKNFIIVDAAMNDLIRPSLYNAYHDILPLNRAPLKRRVRIYDIVGPICESGDFLAKDRKLPELKAGSMLAIMSAGAYGFSMSSNYNSRPRAAEVMVMNNKFYITRKRETYQDLVRGEAVPACLR